MDISVPSNSVVPFLLSLLIRIRPDLCALLRDGAEFADLRGVPHNSFMRTWVADLSLIAAQHDLNVYVQAWEDQLEEWDEAPSLQAGSPGLGPLDDADAHAKMWSRSLPSAEVMGILAALSEESSRSPAATAICAGQGGGGSKRETCVQAWLVLHVCLCGVCAICVSTA